MFHINYIGKIIYFHDVRRLITELIVNVDISVLPMRAPDTTGGDQLRRH